MGCFADYMASLEAEDIREDARVCKAKVADKTQLEIEADARGISLAEHEWQMTRDAEIRNSLSKLSDKSEGWSFTKGEA
tara:strand:+ start:3189 stop:3425 length:237 start_codon:yes stop_codon:yes gene_type:complete